MNEYVYLDLIFHYINMPYHLSAIINDNCPFFTILNILASFITILQWYPSFIKLDDGKIEARNPYI